jgi:hypothetical protein
MAKTGTTSREDLAALLPRRRTGRGSFSAGGHARSVGEHLGSVDD